MRLIPFLNILVLSLTLTSCSLFQSLLTESPQASIGKVMNNPVTEEDRQNYCVETRHNFRQDVDDNLYGFSCIEGAKIHVKTKKDGELVTTTTSAGANLRLEQKDENGKMQEVGLIPNVINKYYQVKFDILDNEENERQPQWLKDLIAQDFSFNGLRDTEYQIVFQTSGNYLVLYKAVKNVDDLPFTERLALPRDSEGNYKADSEGYYKAPFIGYKVEYCHLEDEIDPIQGRATGFIKPACNDVTKKDSPQVVRFDSNNRQSYSYKREKNVFPANYFIGKRWFYTVGDVETADPTAHHYSTGSFFVRLEPKDDHLELVDVSGSTVEANRLRGKLIDVEWKDYEKDCIDALCEFEDDMTNLDSFSERENSEKNTYKQRAYVKIIFPKGREVNDIVIAENYFSYVLSYNSQGRRVK
ncbi:MAG: hypothetical protein OXN83_01650 [Oligoflexia bacterium]|nr:hypothetical protein [Oligoflexia bacterium]